MSRVSSFSRADTHDPRCFSSRWPSRARSRKHSTLVLPSGETPTHTPADAATGGRGGRTQRPRIAPRRTELPRASVQARASRRVAPRRPAARLALAAASARADAAPPSVREGGRPASAAERERMRCGLSDGGVDCVTVSLAAICPADTWLKRPAAREGGGC